MKAVCHTNAGKPAQSLIKRICYPEAFSFKSKAIIWGCQHEQKAQNLCLKNLYQSARLFLYQGQWACYQW